MEPVNGNCTGDFCTWKNVCTGKSNYVYHSDKIVRAQSAEHPVTNKVLGEVATCLNLKTS